MEKERKLYDAFVDIMLEKIESGEISPKELEITMNFLKNNNIQASVKHNGLSALVKSAADLPFEEEEELPLRRVK